MTQIFCGCSDLPRDRRTFYQNATAIEHRVGLFSPPKARVLKSWAEDAANAKSPMRTVWVAWQAFTHRPADIHKGFGAKLLDGESPANFGHFQKTSENLRLWNHIKEQAQNVGASRILLETSANFTPSQANKNALEVFVKEWANLPENLKLVWHAAGFWERDEIVTLASNLGIIPAIDPLVDTAEPLPKIPEIYFQMLGRHGLMDTYSDDDLECLLDAASYYNDVTLIFRTCDSLGDARRLIKLEQTFDPNSASHYDEVIDDFDNDEERYDDDEYDDDEDDLDDEDIE